MVIENDGSELYGIGRVAEDLNCSTSTVRRLTEKAGVCPVRSAGGRKYTATQIQQLRQLHAGRQRYEDVPVDRYRVGEVARELGVRPDAIRKAIRRVEARNPGRSLTEELPIREYGKPITVGLIRSDAVPLIERALRSPRLRKPEHPYRNPSRCRGGSPRRRKSRRSLTNGEDRVFEKLRRKVMHKRLSKLSDSSISEERKVMAAIRWVVGVNMLRRSARRLYLTWLYQEIDEMVEAVNVAVLHLFLKRSPTPEEVAQLWRLHDKPPHMAPPAS